MSATITGIFEDAYGSPYVGDVRFTANSTPEVVSGRIVIGKSKLVQTDATGNLPVGLTLQPGDYTVSVKEERFEITVPINSGVYDIRNLIASGATIVKILGLDFSAAKNSQYIAVILY